MKAVGVDGQVPLEELCWPLDKERLCARYTGVSWDTLSIDMELNKTEGLAERFQHQLELASYVRAQIDLFAEMLNGEPYTVILVLEKIFPFSNLVTIVSNNNLPYVIRGSFVKVSKKKKRNETTKITSMNSFRKIIVYMVKDIMPNICVYFLLISSTNHLFIYYLLFICNCS